MNNILSDIFAGLDDTSDLTPGKPADTAFEAAETDSDGGAKIADVEAIRAFVLGGKATFTLRSLKTGTRFTYRVRISDDGAVAFVSLLTGADNEASYSYFGNIRPRNLTYWHGKKAKVSDSAPGAQAFAWFWSQLQRRQPMPELEFWHSGACARCGRRLTVPSSIASGFGPECATKIGF
jgi:hypothetical protein